ncbi:predicted protein [Sclerotinia sclerotiorum 1980 UF-70]|uniref:Uncharacterized protein n=2 Tax=Sclerotinia sclerotiorum (strain ATCC 18683 / 1980 / Ss-1) TaxID=665079 RepID=A7F4W3_SCLS1|nr:predicted protein [Sclerotinia sclerotiorum 1980 UF-70]APA10562.1 hypothetical protein sscle_06g053320 [Sclerotinia sclerotiorum 1980 UF-70]EDN97784.1 predicted protein [Sclerotinia sclerotiorum 1980 UF-70]
MGDDTIIFDTYPASLTLQTTSTLPKNELTGQVEKASSRKVDEQSSALSQVPNIQPDTIPLVSASRQPHLSDNGVSLSAEESSEELKHVTKPFTSTAIEASANSSDDKNPKSLKDLVESFEKLRLELIGFSEERVERSIETRVFDEKRILIEKFENLSEVFREINENTKKNNDLIQKINDELGANYPLQELRVFSMSDTDEHIVKFTASLREQATAKKEQLRKEFEAIKLEISMVLDIPTMSTSPPSNIKPAQSKDDASNVARILEENASLQIKLDAAQKAQARAEAALEQYKACPPQSNSTTAAVKQESEIIEPYLPYYRVTAQFCSRVRHGFHHSGRRIHHGGAIREIEGRGPASKEVIDLRNETCHRGDIAADFALFMVDPNRAGWNVGGERYNDFLKSYRITPEECKTLFLFSKGYPPSILLEPLNMHATMYRCYFKTIYNSNSKNDKDFETSFERIFLQYRRLLSTNGVSLWTDRHRSLVNHLNSDKQAKADQKAMEEIVRETIAHQKAQLVRA